MRTRAPRPDFPSGRFCARFLSDNLTFALPKVCICRYNHVEVHYMAPTPFSPKSKKGRKGGRQRANAQKGRFATKGVCDDLRRLVFNLTRVQAIDRSVAHEILEMYLPVLRQEIVWANNI